MKFSLILLFGALAGLGSAATVSYSGNTAPEPVWQRPIAGSNSLSGVGNATRYDAQVLTVSLTGLYSFLSESTGWDNYTFLYVSSFNPTAPLINLVTGNGDLGSLTRSGFGTNLTAGVTYHLVTTGFSNGDFGRFTNTISGPGSISLSEPTSNVPEPSSMALVAVGAMGVALLRRRK